ncbi:hypothetical protein GCM10007301_44440 [Azorhizobium oxalatiphilum]|uniref:Uncharacterized protein n=1 Tax=Azorhizobium oxalatiphilum TaxID=980631 RepID=A0A917CCV1_9HYPH|nr:hypothetical protein [Azorhizobium oxalatiphilum]GGF79504.1 hypothetical protein GCM10007301_44440 [Azorhizobium oxalatiphilum]
MASREEIDTAIEAIIRERLQSAKVLRVLVEHDVEIDGSLYVQIRVICKAKKKRLDPGETSQMLRPVWDMLAEKGSDRFPLIDYIDEKEAGELSAA